MQKIGLPQLEIASIKGNLYKKVLASKGVVQDKLSQYLCYYKRSIDTTLYIFIWVYNCYNNIVYLLGGIKNR